MYHIVYLLVKATIRTSYPTAKTAVTELQQKATCFIGSTKKVKVEKLEFVDYKMKT
ncbi:MAG: hypothetical protein JWR50_3492 [Mucilaginibacter sp.]|nr:hypothetical protein [Mucilaginibacter sp.]